MFGPSAVTTAMLQDRLTTAVCKLLLQCDVFISVSEYVNLYVDYLLNRSMYQQFASFYHGFHSVCASNALIVSTSFTFPGQDQ